MRPAQLRRGLAAIALAATLASCASDTAEKEALAQAEAARAAALAARTPPPISLGQAVAEDAAVYLAFSRDMATIRGGFAGPEEIQAALRRGAAYDPERLSRGLVAYAAVLALQSPEFVSGVRQYAVDPNQRRELAANIAADPRWASYLPGSQAGAALITETLRQEIRALGDAASSIENDAYAIQNSWDPRRSWGVAQVAGREARLEDAKVRSVQPMTASAGEAARLLQAARSGTGLGASGATLREAPFPPVVERALALAALAALGQAGDDARARTDALQAEPVSQACLNLSKLMLFQCLAASRPSYEDMFCLGRHVVRDLGTCARGAALPAGIVTVSAPVDTPDIRVDSTPDLTALPRITPVDPLAPQAPPISLPPPVSAPAPRTPAPTPTIAPSAPPLSATERLNTTLQPSTP